MDGLFFQKNIVKEKYFCNAYAIALLIVTLMTMAFMT